MCYMLEAVSASLGLQSSLVPCLAACAALLALLALPVLRWLGEPRRRRRQLLASYPLRGAGGQQGRDILTPVMDAKRQAAIARGEATDHTGAVFEEEDPTYSLEGSIFASVPGILERTILRKQLSRVPYWKEAALLDVSAAFSAIPPCPKPDAALGQFMLEECDFKLEHADGSFMDHVSFCHDYCAKHYKGQSPRVLLLHSILGVGTNVFPMEVSKLAKLEALVSPEEMKHIEAFPSVLRMIVDGPLVRDLRKLLPSIDRLRSVRFSRVIDNKALEMNIEDLWVHLNFHIVHLMDFLPLADWPSRVAEPLFQVFLELRGLLEAAGQLRAKVDLGSAIGPPPSQAVLQGSAATSPYARVKRGFLSRGVRRYSAEIKHDIGYKWSLH